VSNRSEKFLVRAKSSPLIHQSLHRQRTIHVFLYSIVLVYLIKKITAVVLVVFYSSLFTTMVA